MGHHSHGTGRIARPTRVSREIRSAGRRGLGLRSSSPPSQNRIDNISWNPTRLLVISQATTTVNSALRHPAIEFSAINWTVSLPVVPLQEPPLRLGGAGADRVAPGSTARGRFFTRPPSSPIPVRGGRHGIDILANGTPGPPTGEFVRHAEQLSATSTVRLNRHEGSNLLDVESRRRKGSSPRRETMKAADLKGHYRAQTRMGVPNGGHEWG